MNNHTPYLRWQRGQSSRPAPTDCRTLASFLSGQTGYLAAANGGLLELIRDVRTTSRDNGFGSGPPVWILRRKGRKRVLSRHFHCRGQSWRSGSIQSHHRCSAVSTDTADRPIASRVPSLPTRGPLKMLPREGDEKSPERAQRSRRRPMQPLGSLARVGTMGDPAQRLVPGSQPRPRSFVSDRRGIRSPRPAGFSANRRLC